ncbi:hypothetical protein Pa4123_21400 [Phytohabitans aurantiacus]|uniref:Uncharacterized protein n=1 Tax=Phytohabitans aurantiacus TaxID=3016789 RepID=A0ABQ5QQG3_9ACTN|nr:hypothetical protein Pa4123_21400 [Phytohabitans aurantiacus]
MHVEKRSNRVHSPLIGATGVATRRAALAARRPRVDRRSKRVHLPLIAGEGAAPTGAVREGAALGGGAAPTGAVREGAALGGGAARECGARRRVRGRGRGRLDRLGVVGSKVRRT